MINLVANSRAHVALLAALPALGITLAQGQTVEQAIQARLAATGPTPEQLSAGVAAFLKGHGLEVAAGQTPDQALTAFLTAHGIEVAQGQNLKQAFESFVSELGQVEAQLTSVQAQLALYTGALAKHGIKVVAKDAKAGITAADIEAAIAARISTKAAEHLAQTGAPQVETQPAATPGSDAAKPQPAAGLTGYARTRAAFAAKATAPKAT